MNLWALLPLATAYLALGRAAELPDSALIEANLGESASNDAAACPFAALGASVEKLKQLSSTYFKPPEDSNAVGLEFDDTRDIVKTDIDAMTGELAKVFKILSTWEPRSGATLVRREGESLSNGNENAVQFLEALRSCLVVVEAIPKEVKGGDVIECGKEGAASREEGGSFASGDLLIKQCNEIIALLLVWVREMDVAGKDLANDAKGNQGPVTLVEKVIDPVEVKKSISHESDGELSDTEECKNPALSSEGANSINGLDRSEALVKKLCAIISAKKKMSQRQLAERRSELLAFLNEVNLANRQQTLAPKHIRRSASGHCDYAQAQILQIGDVAVEPKEECNLIGARRDGTADDSDARDKEETMAVLGATAPSVVTEHVPIKDSSSSEDSEEEERDESDNLLENASHVDSSQLYAAVSVNSGLPDGNVSGSELEKSSSTFPAADGQSQSLENIQGASLCSQPTSGVQDKDSSAAGSIGKEEA